MIGKEILETIIEGQQIFGSKNPIARDISFDLRLVKDLGKIITISGVRRAGKTMYLKQIAEQMNVLREEVVFLDFSESVLSNFSFKDFEALPVQFMKIYPDLKPVFFFDEIQEIENFERGLRYLQNKGYEIFVTGSSAQLFSRDIASRLRGKTAEIKVFPLMLSEFLRFRQFEVKPAYSQAEKARLSVLLGEHIRWGGFPEVVLMENIDTKKYLLNGYLNTMLLRDVIEKNNVQNAPLIDRLLTKLIKSFTKNISVHKWYNDFKSMGFKVSKDTLYLYLGYLKETGFFHSIHEYGKPQGSMQKVYLIDNGLFGVRRDRGSDNGKLLENMIFNKIQKDESEISYFADGKSELDFVTPDKIVQVCYLLNQENLKREFSGFEQFEQQYGTGRTRSLVVIEEDKISDGISIGFYDYMLDITPVV